MAILQPNMFSSYSLSTQEEESGSVLSPLQKMVLQNKLAAIAAQKLKITFDPTNPVAFAQNEAMLAGQISIIEWLIDTSDSIEKASQQQSQGNNSNN